MSYARLLADYTVRRS